MMEVMIRTPIFQLAKQEKRLYVYTKSIWHSIVACQLIEWQDEFGKSSSKHHPCEEITTQKKHYWEDPTSA